MIFGRELSNLRLTSEQTRGAIGVLEGTSQPGDGPPRHIHRSCDELFYVLEGEFLFLVGVRRAMGEPGTLVYIPRGVVHAVKAISRQPGRVLVAYVPGGQEHAFEEFGRSPRDVVAAKYDSKFVGHRCRNGAPHLPVGRLRGGCAPGTQQQRKATRSGTAGPPEGVRGASRYMRTRFSSAG